MHARIIRASSALTAGATLIVAPALFLTSEARSQTYTPEIIVQHLAGKVGQSLGPPGGEVRSLVLAPTDPNRLYAGTATGHVYASNDAAQSWRMLGLELPHEAVVDNLLVHPGNADIVYAAYWSPTGAGGLARTRDGGTTWEELPVPGTPSLRAIAAAPSDVRTMYIGGIGGVWRSDDGGERWRNVNGKGLATEFIESLAIDPRDPEHVYAGTWRQVYRSRDGGATWARIYQGMAIDRDIFSLAISPYDPDTVLAGTCNFLYCSKDSGDTWDERRSGLATDHNRVHTIVHDPRDPEILYAGTRGALYQSLDTGESWNVILADVSVSAVVLSPDRDEIYVGTEERGVLVGRPGDAFAESNTGLTGARVVAFDALPGAPRVLFAARADGPLRSSIHYSTDIGQSWRPLGFTPSIGEIQVIRAQTRPVNRILVVGATGWWSVYPGGRWVPVPAPPGELAALEIAHDSEGRVLAATSSGLYLAEAVALADQSGESRPFDAGASAIWRPVWEGGALEGLTVVGDELMAAGQDTTLSGSISGAASGARLQLASASGLRAPLIGLARHPTDPTIAYAISTHEVYRTADGGRSWSFLLLPWPAAELRDVAMDPAKPDQVLALDYRGALYRGHGAGEHWLVIDEDRDLYRAWRLRVSDQAPGFALVATQGHGLRVISIDPLALPSTDDGEGR